MLVKSMTVLLCVKMLGEMNTVQTTDMLIVSVQSKSQPVKVLGIVTKLKSIPMKSSLIMTKMEMVLLIQKI